MRSFSPGNGSRIIFGSMFPSYWEAVAGAEVASADTRERFNLLADGNLKRITLEVDHLRPVIRNYTRHEASRCIGYHREVHIQFLYRTAEGSLPE